MPELVALDLPGDAGYVDVVRRVWDRGDAVFPVDQRLGSVALRRVFDAVRPTRVWDAGGERALPDGRPTDDGDALVIATSGSTGTPKGVVHTHRALAASASAGNARLSTSTDDHWLACLPLAHVGGFTVITKALLAGCRLSVHPSFDASAVERAAREGVSMVSLVPTALARVDPSWFRIVLLGGSRPPAERPANCIATYGLTETGSGVVYDGVPLDGVEIELRAGEVLVRGPMLMRAYRDGSTTIDADGWLHTADMGSWRADGRLQVLGRRGDMIITGGENVWPDAVEAVLAEHPAVAEVAVAGVDDDTWGQRVCAWVVPAAAGDVPTLAELRRLVAERIAPFASPKELRLVSELPRTALGKIRRDLLAATEGDVQGERRE